MRTVATLDPSVRLVVIQFLIPETLVPEIVPPKGPAKGPPVTARQVSGVEVLKSNSGVYLLHLLDGICPIDEQGQYGLVDSWFVPHFPNKSFVRYVLCRKEYVNHEELHSNFVANRDGLLESLVNLANDNLWTVQGHLNPYFDKEGRPSNHQVLMLGCAGRQPAVDSNGLAIKVFRDGRDADNRGIGPKVSIVEKALRLQVVGNEIFLMAPEPTLAQAV